MKRYVIFAGVNGAGKTTLYQTNDDFKNMSDTLSQISFQVSLARLENQHTIKYYFVDE